MIECPFWHAVQARMVAEGYPDFELGNFAMRFDTGDRTLERLYSGSLRWTILEDLRDWALHAGGLDGRFRELGRRNRAFATVVTDILGKSVFLDASKERMRLRYLRRYLGMDVKAIHLVRDVRGVAASARRHGTQESVRSGARMWARTNSAILRHIGQMSARDWTLIRYEDLCDDPAGTTARLYEFCGVDQPSPETSETQHLLGNPRRLQVGQTIDRDLSWQTQLDRVELDGIRATAGTMVQKLYPEAIGWRP